MTQVLGHALVAEFASIVRGKHPGWSGDRIANGEAFIRRFQRDTPWMAARIAHAIKTSPENYEDIGLSPGSLKTRLPRMLKGTW